MSAINNDEQRVEDRLMRHVDSRTDSEADEVPVKETISLESIEHNVLSQLDQADDETDDEADEEEALEEYLQEWMQRIGVRQSTGTNPAATGKTGEDSKTAAGGASTPSGTRSSGDQTPAEQVPPEPPQPAYQPKPAPELGYDLGAMRTLANVTANSAINTFNCGQLVRVALFKLLLAALALICCFGLLRLYPGDTVWYLALPLINLSLAALWTWQYWKIARLVAHANRERAESAA